VSYQKKAAVFVELGIVFFFFSIINLLFGGKREMIFVEKDDEIKEEQKNG
jgi:hypothetical protein